MNHGTSWSALAASAVTFLISIFRPEEWMVIGIIVGIAGTIFTCWANWYWKKRLFKLQRQRITDRLAARQQAKNQRQ